MIESANGEDEICLLNDSSQSQIYIKKNPDSAHTGEKDIYLFSSSLYEGQ